MLFEHPEHVVRCAAARGVACRGHREINIWTMIRKKIQYGHEAKPSISGVEIVYLVARRDYYYYGARQKL